MLWRDLVSVSNFTIKSAMQSITFTSVMRLEYRVSIVVQACNDLLFYGKVG